MDKKHKLFMPVSLFIIAMMILLALCILLIGALLIPLLNKQNNPSNVAPNFNSSREIAFQVSPDLDPPTSLYSTQSLSQILSNSDYTPDGHKVIGIWDNINGDDLKLIEDETDISNPFIRAAYYAYANHFPLKIRVDDVWLAILQSASMDINNRSEELRNNFVNFTGKLTLTVRRDSFILDSPLNDWGGVAKEFVEKIGVNTIGDFKEITSTTFSTTSEVDLVASAMTIMEAVKSYFNYRVLTVCGFPYIILEGTHNDWLLLKNSTSKLLAKLGTFGEEWGLSLLPLLDRMMEPFVDQIDTQFWNSMLKRGARFNCRPDNYISGWINILFPFIIDSELTRNSFTVPYQPTNDYANPNFVDSKHYSDDRSNVYEGYYTGQDENLFPIGLSSAPVEWCYFSTLYNLQFKSGFLGVSQEEDGLIAPQVGWYVLREITEDYETC